MSMPGGSSTSGRPFSQPFRRHGNMCALTDIERSGTMEFDLEAPRPAHRHLWRIGRDDGRHAEHVSAAQQRRVGEPSQHVNHKVAITGTLSDAAHMPMSGSPSTGKIVDRDDRNHRFDECWNACGRHDGHDRIDGHGREPAVARARP